MIDWTDRHCRYFHRLIAPRIRLYTEMITTGAILHGGDPERFLGFSEEEHPVAAQLGGSDPAALAESAQLVEAFGYDEVNLNVGCPSDRVQSGRFGACLMAEPKTVAACVRRMIETVGIPVTVKTRIGIDDSPGYPFFEAFIERVADVGCSIFIIHARKAWLQGLSPKENREVPPLEYDQVYRLKDRHPELCILINGGITKAEAACHHLNHVDGVMIGREAYQNPYSLVAFEGAVSGDIGERTRLSVLEAMVGYARHQMERGAPLKAITRHLLGLYNGLPGARRYRRMLSDHAVRAGADPEIMLEAASMVRLPDRLAA